MVKHPKIIVLDDDPTGSQTVHSCLLLLQWDVETLRAGLRDPSPLLFILTNTRANPPAVAAQITREVCQNLRTAVTDEAVQDYLVVSRSDSTLRGHYPLETDIIAQELGPFDAHFLVPAFLEGGRITQESIHYVITQGKRIPVHQTEFAQDAVFGFDHSYLPDYVAEKTQGRIPASQVERFLGPVALERLLQLKDNQCVVVDAQVQADLDQFAVQLLQATAQGKRFLFRSAASLLTALAQLPPQPVPAEQVGQYRRSKQPGIFIVGSYVRKTTQ
ncbi:MAG: four-carbon acid sugar kinase family protein, partial [Cyanobacteria bacterium P01_A01_bin.17]